MIDHKLKYIKENKHISLVGSSAIFIDENENYIEMRYHKYSVKNGMEIMKVIFLKLEGSKK